jgi:hypothetical protein
MTSKILDFNEPSPKQYTTNAEYRELLRRFFAMNIPSMLEKLRNIYPNFDDFEEDTRDELLFDTHTVENGMNHIFEKTRDTPSFRTLYLAAAALMISENPDIGLAVLMSYDYFYSFYHVLRTFFIEGEDKVESCSEWIELKKRLHS